MARRSAVPGPPSDRHRNSTNFGATSWISDLSQSCGDLRFLNTACKLTGAVWLLHNRVVGEWRRPDLAAQLAALGHLLDEATARLRTRLAERILLAEPYGSGDDGLRPIRLADKGQALRSPATTIGPGTSIAGCICGRTAATRSWKARLS